MTKMNWTRVVQEKRAGSVGAYRADLAEKKWRKALRKQAKTATPRKRPQPTTHSPRASVHWPVFITLGADPNRPGCLKVVELKSRAHADSLGYTWAGR